MIEIEERLRASAAALRREASDLASTHDPLGATTAIRPLSRRPRRVAMVLAGALVVALAVALPAVLRRDEQRTPVTFTPNVSGPPPQVPNVTGDSVEPARTGPVTTRPAPTQPATTQPATTQPATTQPATTQPAPPETVSTETVRPTGVIASEPVERPITSSDSPCRSLWAHDAFGPSLTLDARPGASPVIQVFARAETESYDRFAVVQRFVGGDYTADGSSSVAVGDLIVWLTDVPNRTTVSWNTADGSLAMVDAVGLTHDEVMAFIASLTPRDPSSAVPGFDRVADGVSAGLALQHEASADDVVGSYAGVSCRAGDGQPTVRISAINGDPIYRYATLVDRPDPLQVAERAGTLFVINGSPGSSIPSLDDIRNATPQEWEELTSQAPIPATPDPISISFDEWTVVPLLSTDPSKPADNTTVSLRFSDTGGKTFLEIDKSGVRLAAEAVFWAVSNNGSRAGRTTARAGGVYGTPVSGDPMTLNVSVIDGGEFVLQSTGTLTLTGSG